ncbi:amino acid permease [Streptomyces sp. LHD-70]|uniref:APC family permease n=1 Tax=Streptomyces sp. LHD-70 TaxID=3072140 RepID=UPI00280DF445|nr:amino acid permease [Streptomyces sp. LHD-70]MDQ8706174.1 amino acid permease [Streptomyces sp. LHD-70]
MPNISEGGVVERAGLGVGAGTALCVGAVLGPGALTLVSTAAAAAGPASLLAWVGLIGLSLPVALAFAALGARYPGAGGVAGFVQRAFGNRPAVCVGWWFYWAVPLGVPAAALVAGEYVAVAAGWGGRWAVGGVALVLLLAAYGANLAGLRLSGRLQLVMVGLIVLLLAATVVVAAGQVRGAHFAPFAPLGWASVGRAAGVLFFAFAGWEAVTHLSGEFASPGRDLRRTTLLAWGVVAFLYLGLASVTIGVLGARTGGTATPLTLLLEGGIGSAARPLVAVAALLLSFGAINAYLAGGARLGATLGLQGAMPQRLVTSPAGSPGRSLTLLALVSAAVVLASAFGALALDTLLRATSACLVAVTLAGLLSATSLLPGRSLLRLGAAVSAVVTAGVLVFCGPYLVLPAALAAAACVFHSVSRSRVHRSAFHSSPAPSTGAVHAERRLHV